MIINKIYAIDTLGKYPIAYVEYKNCSPSWTQYQDDKQIQEYINTYKDYVINDPYFKF